MFGCFFFDCITNYLCLLLVTIFLMFQDVSLPEFKIDDIDHMDENTKKLLQWSNKLQNYWKASPYLLEETTSKSMHLVVFTYALLHGLS